jgi:hypothetical protein
MAAPGHAGLFTAAALLLAATAIPEAAAAQMPGQASPLHVSNAVVATSVVDREPVGAGEAFGPNVGELYFHMIVEGDFREATLEHVWIRNGQEVARVPLTVRGPRWRTWSSKAIPSDWTGEWQVQVVDPEGEVLDAVSFTVGG